MFTGNSNIPAFRQAVRISKSIYNGIKCRRYGNSDYLCHFCSASLCQEIIYTIIMFLGD